MDEYSEYNPEYAIEGITFRLYNSDEIKALSVKHIKNPETFDNLMQPTFGGLYDPALGPTDRDDACTTCGQNGVHCPGHMGHIELPLVCYNPIFFKSLFQLLNSICLYCHRMKVSPIMGHVFVQQCRLLDHGHVVAVGHLLELYSQTAQMEVDKQTLTRHVMEAVTDFTDNIIKGKTSGHVLVKNVESARQDLVTGFTRENIKRVGKCLHCSARGKKLRQENMAKILMMGQLIREDEAPTVDYRKTKANVEIDPNSDDEADEPRPKKQKVNDSSAKSSEATLLTAKNIREHLREVWKLDRALLRRLYPSMLSSTADYPTDIFFLDTIPVPPSRFRPISELKGHRYENPQTSNLARVLKNCAIVTELLWEIEKATASTELPSDHVVPMSVSITKGKTLFEKLNTAWTTLQICINSVVDSNLDKFSKDVNPGIKQLLEKKQGLFRKNMMGKRVNYACRSVISPDPNINTNEIGIPEVFAKALTYPQPVTPWNIHELRQAVINGPKKHPGARFVVNEDGSKVLLDDKARFQRLSIANQLLKPTTTFQGKVLTGTKKVYRHLKNGDVLLINRQPTLHRPSIQAHKARVLPREKTLRLHYANCKAYNADFDGDEMNAHFPQNEIARAEAYTIASTDYQYLVPKDGTPLAGLIQDHMVSGVTLTIRGRYFVKDDYCKLVYAALIDKSGPVRMLPPTILKPYRLWSGKQVLSTVVLNVIPGDKPPLSLTGSAKIPEKNWIKVKNATGTTPPFMGESDVVIRQGELLCGVLDKGHYGPTPFGLVHSCYELYGGKVAGQLLTCFGRLFLNFLQIRGFTLGVEDILVTPKADKKRRKIVEKSPHCGEDVAKKGLELDNTADRDAILTALRTAHFSSNDRHMRELDIAMRSQTNDIQNNIVNLCMPSGLQQLFPANNLQLMVQSGAKGSSVNCMQISCLLGQIELEGKRPPLMLSGQTLPSFLPYDLTPRAGGFVTGRFLTGIRQQEYFFHCMAGREGLIDTAVKTSRSGYLQRCLIKHLEGIKVNYDLTVRDGDGSVVQFYYGEDSLDICKTGYLTPKQFPFLIDNQQILPDDSSQQTEHQPQLRKLRKEIAKWHKKNSIDASLKLRTSGFLKFCQSVTVDMPSTGDTDNGHTWPGRNRQDVGMCQRWRGVSDKQKRKYSKWTGPCPAPVLSQYLPYTQGALPERFDDILNKFAKTHLADPSCGISEERFRQLMNVKLRQSIAEPGDAVGLLCAQSIGEPSTQMTLNTFHFAGRGEMNVTLGIPRLREILMVGSKNIKTPAMDIPVLPGDAAKVKVKKLQKRFNRVYLNEVLKDIQVCEWLAIKGESRIHRRRVFRVRFEFLPPACYKERFTLSPGKILRFMEKSYIKTLVRMIMAKMKALTKMRLLGAGKQKSYLQAPARGEESETPTQERAAMDDDDVDDEDYDGDAAEVKDKQRHAQEREYEDEEQEAEDGGVVDDDAQSDRDIEGDVEMDDVEEDGDLEETLIREVEERERRKETAEARRHVVCQIGSEVQDYTYDVRKQLWCEITLNFPLADSKVDLLALIEKEVKRAVVHEVPNIANGFLGDQQGPYGTELHFTTEGVNMREVYDSSDILDLNRLYCNSIHHVADTYGIEAASKVIVKEIQSVFAAYGIDVDYRHLSLLADYMTFEGKYKPFNCHAIHSNPSPLQKMSFERTMQFLVDTSINEGMDDLTSPSAQIVLGKNVTCGTGSHDLLIPLKV